MIALALALLPQQLENGWRPLLDAELTGWTADVRPPAPGFDASDVFTVVELEGEPVLRVRGHTWGALVSDDEFGNYALRAEFRWGDEHWPPLDFRDAGVMVHSRGEPFAVATGMGTHVGDIPKLGPLAEPPGSGAFRTSFEYQIVADLVPGGPRTNLAGDFVWLGPVRANLRYRRPRPQRAQGRWNELEIRCHGDGIVHLLNGEVVAWAERARDPAREPITRGRIQIQAEGDEILFRRLAVRPIHALLEPDPGGWSERHAALTARIAAAEADDARLFEALLARRALASLDPLEGIIEPFDGENWFERARLHARLGDEEGVIEALGRAISYGFTAPGRIETEPAFDALRGENVYSTLVASAGAYLQHSTPVYFPDTVPDDEPLTVLVVLHGEGGNAHGIFHAYGRAATELGAALVSLRAPHPSNEGDAEPIRFSWGQPEIDVPATLARLDAGLGQLDRQRRFERKRVVVLGYGRGATAALHLLAERPNFLRGAYLVGSRLPGPDERVWKAVGERRIALEAKSPAAIYALAASQRWDFELRSRILAEDVLRTDHRTTWLRGERIVSSSEHLAEQVETLRWLLRDE